MTPNELVSALAETYDGYLIDELKRRGYRVVRADRIRTASVVSEHWVHDLRAADHEANRMAALYRDLGAQLGVFLMKTGALPVIEEMAERNRDGLRALRTVATLIVEDPKFDWPYRHEEA